MNPTTEPRHVYQSTLTDTKTKAAGIKKYLLIEINTVLDGVLP